MTKLLRINKRRSLLYSTSLSIGLIMLVVIKSFSFAEMFVFASIVLFLVLLVELYISTNYLTGLVSAKSGHTKFPIDGQISHFFNHITLPILFYWGMVAFIYLNNIYWFKLALAPFIFITLLFLFFNINSYYDKEVKQHKASFYIYDIVSSFTIFLWIYTLVLVGSTSALPMWFGFIAAFILILISMILVISRHKVTLGIVLTSLITTVIITLVFALLFYSSVNAMLTAFVVVASFHMFILLLDMYDNKDIIDVSYQDIIDYIALMVLVFALLNLF